VGVEEKMKKANGYPLEDPKKKRLQFSVNFLIDDSATPNPTDHPPASSLSAPPSAPPHPPRHPCAAARFPGNDFLQKTWAEKPLRRFSSSRLGLSVRAARLFSGT
jgi:hypothetical protein